MAGNQKRFWRFQLTAARRRLGAEAEAKAKAERVSTHSRPKAAGAAVINTEMIHESFNSQPPEGGWAPAHRGRSCTSSFNSQPPEGGWEISSKTARSTGSFNSQPHEGGWHPKPTRMPP